MKNFPWRLSLFGLILLINHSCVEPYQPPQIVQETSHLVVEGYLNPAGPSVIRLTRTQQLDEQGKPATELKARLGVEGERGGIYSFEEKGDGDYQLTTFQAFAGEKYRLRIKTANGKEYLSEYVPVKTTPAIQSVSWEALDDGVHIYVNSGDPEANTRYYQWDFAETWEFTVPYPAGFEYRSGQATLLTNNLYRCWHTELSKNIYIGSSVKLSEDVIYKYRIAFLPLGSPKYNIKYSILVRQRALTKEAYAYWENLRKNTENIGTLFDPLPSQLNSNMTCVNDPEERIFGFFSAHSIQEQRIFITRDQLPKWQRVTGYEYCPLDTILLEDLALSGSNYPRKFYSEVYPEMGPPRPIGYTESAESCMDCRTNGVNQKPDFWQ